MDHGRKLEIDDTVTACDGQSGHRALAGKFAQMNIVFTGYDKTHYVFHKSVPPYCASASI